VRIRVRAAARTDVGKKRDHNEDAYLCAPDDGIFVLADGVGGAAAGEVASEIAIETVREAFLADGNGALGDRLRAALIAAHERIVARAGEDPDLQGMGAAVVAVVFDPAEGRLAIGNVGDARGYRLRDGVAEQVSEDHTLVQRLLAQGRIQPDDVPSLPHRHVLTQALGSSEAVDPTVHTDVVEPGDTFVLCSDGIHDLVTGEEIASAVSASDGDLDGACERLVAMALDRGGHDNATVMVLACEIDARPSITELPIERIVLGGVAVDRIIPPRQHEPARHVAPWVVGAGAIVVLAAIAISLGRVGRVPIAPDGESGPSHPTTPPSTVPAPLSWSEATPVGSEITTMPGLKVSFDARAASAGPVTYQWLLDGKPQADGGAWSFVPVDSDAGTTRKVTVVASAGRERIERNWQLRIGRLPSTASTAAGSSPGNGPRIVAQIPPAARPVQVREGTVIEFRVRLAESAAGTVRHTWYLDGQEVSGGPALSYRPSPLQSEGPVSHRIEVVVASVPGGETTRVGWNVQVISDAPTIAGAYPKNEAVSLAAGARQEFSVSVPPRREGEAPLVYEWTVDGRSTQRGEHGQFAFEGAAGSHVVEVAAIDGNGIRSKTRRWRVEVAAAAAEGHDVSPP
jgi:serine/threonine protein phosphatase PrpC